MVRMRAISLKACEMLQLLPLTQKRVRFDQGHQGSDVKWQLLKQFE